MCSRFRASVNSDMDAQGAIAIRSLLSGREGSRIRETRWGLVFAGEVVFTVVRVDVTHLAVVRRLARDGFCSPG
jgi:hypothetical protein